MVILWLCGRRVRAVRQVCGRAQAEDLPLVFAGVLARPEHKAHKAYPVAPGEVYGISRLAVTRREKSRVSPCM
ncbi:protein of unknown function [Desulfovibrio sp. 86]|nr:protein of unknown function [Desulfovibrio sp. 86]